jgi:signal transduction histidine kinase
MNFQKLIVGNQTIETEAQRRKMLLGAYLILMYLGVDLYYSIVHIFNPEGEPYLLFAGAIISLVCLILIRSGWIDVGILLHLLRSTAAAFYFSIVDANPYETAPFLLFIPGGMGAFAIFSYGERWKGILYNIFTLVLFSVAFFNLDNFKPSHPHFYFISNFFIVFILGGLIISFFDRLSYKSEQRILEKNNELQKANAELDRFVYSASHDLRAPLTSLLGLINLSEMTNDPLESQNYLMMMRARILTLDKFIHDIIDYSRNERLELAGEKIQLKKITNEIVEGLKFVLGTESVSIIVDIDSDLTIHSDQSRIKMILSNLISNSLKYFDKNKGNPYVRIMAQQLTNSCEINVEDNGVGISSDRKDKVFDMFYQASEKSVGSGLGLYIAKECVTKLGGEITVSTTLGEGSTFTVTIPQFNSI